MKVAVLTCGIVAGFVLLAGSASAHDRPDFAAFDADGDGAISLAEVTAQVQAQAADRATEMFERVDADGDGAISTEEFEEMSKKRGRRGHGNRG